VASKLTIERSSGKLIISYPWRTPGTWFMLFFCVCWNLAIIFFLFMGAGIFIALHLLAGVLIAWWTATRFVNKSVITVSREQLEITHGPLPWPFSKDKKIPARALVQLYVDKSNTRINNRPTYNLNAKLDSGTIVKVFRSELDRQRLLDLEHTIESYLDIENDESFDLSESGFSRLNLEQMREQLEKMEPIKKWLPRSIVHKMEEVAAKMEQEARSGPGSGSSRVDDPDVGLRPGAIRARPLPEPTHDFDYPLYRTSEGEIFQYHDKEYRMSRSAQLDFDDQHVAFGRQMELQPTASGEAVYLYAQLERERWAYYEERRLDNDEVARLGFDEDHHPTRFDNGEDRYYPRDGQQGFRFMNGRGTSVQQFIYFTTASATQFRALKPDGRGWEVYVMEVVDGGYFEPRDA